MTDIKEVDQTAVIATEEQSFSETENAEQENYNNDEEPFVHLPQSCNSDGNIPEGELYQTKYDSYVLSIIVTGVVCFTALGMFLL